MLMGEKIIIFVIGLLLGAVIATGAFVVCTKTCHNKGNRGEIMQLPNGNQPQINSHAFTIACNVVSSYIAIKEGIDESKKYLMKITVF